MSGLEAVLLSFALKGKKNIWNIYSEPLEKKNTGHLSDGTAQGIKVLQSITHIHRCSLEHLFTAAQDTANTLTREI